MNKMFDRLGFHITDNSLAAEGKLALVRFLALSTQFLLTIRGCFHSMILLRSQIL